jgi:hypothetical protein
MHQRCYRYLAVSTFFNLLTLPPKIQAPFPLGGMFWYQDITMMSFAAIASEPRSADALSLFCRARRGMILDAWKTRAAAAFQSINRNDSMRAEAAWTRCGPVLK